MDSAKHKHTCLRCGHIWDGRKVGAPIYCPQCNSKRVVPELMGTLKEKIAKVICRSKCLAHSDGCQCSYEVAEAILALLPPMLTKDEASLVSGFFCPADEYPNCNSCYIHYTCSESYRKLVAKLKAIQEGE